MSDRSSASHSDERYDITGYVIDGRIGRSARRNPVSAFFVVAFLYSWGVFVLIFAMVGGERIGDSRLWQLPFAWGPLIGALLVGWLSTGDVRPWLRASADPRTNPKWYLFAAIVAFLYADAPHVLGSLLGVPVAIDRVEEIAVSFGMTLMLAGSLEEFGWRGFAQPRLQERYDALVAAIIIGVAVGIWHYPWLLLAGAGYENTGLGALVALPLVMVLMAVVFAWLFNGSGGTIPVVMLGHAVFNATPAFEFTGDAPSWLSAVGLLLWLGLVVVLVAVYGRTYLAPTSPPPAVVGQPD